MASKKPKAQTSSSRKTRSKRKLTDSPEPVDDTQESQPSAAKRPRRTNYTRNSNQGALEDSLISDLPEASESLSDAGQELELHNEDVQEMDVETRRVQFSDEVEVYDDDEAEPPAAQPVRKMSVKRRNTLSPKTGALQQRFRSASGRHSMPSLSTDSPREKVAVADLVELRMQSMLLNTPRKADGSPGTFNIVSLQDMMVFDPREERAQTASMRLSMTNTENHASPALSEDIEESLISHANKQWANERQRLHDKIKISNESLHHLRNHVQLHLIELQSLVGTADEHDLPAYAQTLREAFDRVRQALSTADPTALDEDMTNIEMLDLLVSDFSGFVQRITSLEADLQSKAELIDEHITQEDGLIDGLAQSQIINNSNANQLAEATAQARRLRQDLAKLHEAHAASQLSNTTLRTQAHGLQEKLSAEEKKNADLEFSAKRLKESLRKYQQEERKMQDIISRMERDHKATIAEMALDLETIIKDFEDKAQEIDDQHRKDVLAADQRDAQAKQLEKTADDLKDERDALLQQVAGLEEASANTQSEHEQAKADLQIHREQAKSLDLEMERKTQELDMLKEEMTSLKYKCSSEQIKLKSMESERDTANKEVKKLNQHLIDAGQNANMLRGQIFQIQQERGAEIAQLKQDAVKQEQKSASEKQQEVTRREQAEKRVKEHTATITRLKKDLQDTQDRMTALLTERNDTIQNLKRDAKKDDDTIAELKKKLQDINTRLNMETAQTTKLRQDHKSKIEGLKKDLAAQRDRIVALSTETEELTELNDKQVGEHGDAIAALNKELEESKSGAGVLQKQKLDLERRIEEAASQLLHAQADHKRKAETANDTIEDQKHKIANIEMKAREADQSWQDLRDANVELIATLRQEKADLLDSGKAKDEEIKRLGAQVANFTHKFEEISRVEAIANTRISQATKQQHNMLQKEINGTLDEMKRTPVAKRSTKAVSERKRRAYDSGIGVASDEIEESMAA